jgi:hypothetical protein
LAEATLGHLLHLAPVPGLAGIVMAPIGLLAMGRAFLATGRLWAVPAVSALAASVKLADLFYSVRGPEAVLRPALAILAEGLAAAALLAVLRRPAARGASRG